MPKKASPFTPTGFDKVVLGLLGEMQTAAFGPEKAALDAFIAKLDVDWPNMTKAQRTKTIASAAKSYLGLTKSIGPKVGRVLKDQGPGIVVATKMSAKKAFALSITPSFSAVDKKMVDHTASANGHYIRDQYGTRSVQMSNVARNIVANGLEKGLSRQDIAKSLSAALPQAGRTDAYFQMIASVFTGRARTFGHLSALTEAGIETFTFEAVLDEVTTEICRFMHGQTFSVAAGLQRYQDVEDAEDPEAVKDLQPWASVGKTDDGASALFYKSGGQRTMIASIDQAAIGAKDKIGSYGNAMTPGQLQGAGLSCPPLHGHCRSTIIPGVGTAPLVEHPAPAPPPPAAPAPAAASVNTPQAGLPANIAELVRPLPNRSLSGETLPELSLEEKAEQYVNSWFSDKEAWNGPNDPNMGWPSATDPDAPKGFVDHSFQSVPKQADGSLGQPWKSGEVTGNMVGGAKKKKPTEIAISDLVHPSADYSVKQAYESFQSKAYNDPNNIIVVKTGGVYYVKDHQGSAHIQAKEWMELGKANQGGPVYEASKTKVAVKVIDLDAKAAKKPKAEKLPTPLDLVLEGFGKPPPAKVPPIIKPAAEQKLTADDIMFKKTGDAKGSNSGGFYEGKDGTKRYVKFYNDPTQAHCEHLANQIYNDLGLGAPNSHVVVEGGKTIYASDLFEGEILANKQLTKALAQKVMGGFGADVLTGNWDAVGTGMNNAFVKSDGSVARIDQGGTFLFRAQAGRKPTAVLNAITETEVFFSSKNAHYQQVANTAGYYSVDDMGDVLKKQISDIVELHKAAGGWASYLRTKGVQLPDADHKAVVEMLEKRTELLKGKLEELSRPKPAPPKPGEARYTAKQMSSVLPKAGLKLADLPETNAYDTWARDREEGAKHTNLPSGEDQFKFKQRAAKAVEKIAAESTHAIKEFTNGDYGEIRDSEEKGKPNRASDHIQRAFKVATPEPGTVYRGIHVASYKTGMERQEARDAVIEQFLTKKEWGLGRQGVGAVSSSSWDIDVAVNNFMDGTDEPRAGSYKILFKLNGRTQIPVETISSVSHERELLISRNARFRTTGISRLKGKTNVLVVEAEEITTAEDVQKRLP